MAPHSKQAGSLNVDRGSLAPKGFLGSEGSWPRMETVKTAQVREGKLGREAAGMSLDRWHCVA